MNTFDFQRFYKVFTRLLLLRKGILIKWSLTVAAIVFLVSLLTSSFSNTNESYGPVLPYTIAAAIGIATGLISGGSSICGTFVISDIEDKQGRMFELMLPATNLEKFLSMVIFTLIVLPLALFAGVILADLTQQLFSMLLHHGARASIIGSYYDDIVSEFDIKGAFAIVLLYINTNAIAVLGGVFFRKTAWLKTGIALLIISMTIGIIGTLFGVLLAFNPDYEVYLPEWMHNAYFGYSLLIIVAGCLYWLAYRIFTHLQVISNRFINI